LGFIVLFWAFGPLDVWAKLNLLILKQIWLTLKLILSQFLYIGGKVGVGLKSVFTKEFYVSNEQINKILSGGSIMGKLWFAVEMFSG
jgi:hypothetical protein